MNASQKHWFKKRGYLHFDFPIGPAKAHQLVESPACVARHSFLPLISYIQQSEKVSKHSVTGKLTTISKERPICYAAHKDSAIYSYYGQQLSDLYENRIAEHNLQHTVLAFRSLNKTNIHFAKTAFDAIQELGNCTAIALDISKFFQNIDHQILKKQWCELLDEASLPADHYAVFKSITKYAAVDRAKLYKLLNISPYNPKNNRERICSAEEFRNTVRRAGIIETNTRGVGLSQGLTIGALISNIYMFPLDKIMNTAVSALGGRYYRYCDDMLFIVPCEFRQQVLELAYIEIEKLKLTINKEKEEVRTFSLNNGHLTSDKPLQYLGFTFDGQRILIRSSALSRYHRKMKRGVWLASATMRKHNRIRSRKKQDEHPLYRRKLFARYSHLGKNNFLSYGYRAADHMGSNAIRKQLKPLWGKLLGEIEKVAEAPELVIEVAEASSRDDLVMTI